MNRKYIISVIIIFLITTISVSYFILNNDNKTKNIPEGITGDNLQKKILLNQYEKNINKSASYKIIETIKYMNNNKTREFKTVYKKEDNKYLIRKYKNGKKIASIFKDKNITVKKSNNEVNILNEYNKLSNKETLEVLLYSFTYNIETRFNQNTEVIYNLYSNKTLNKDELKRIFNISPDSELNNSVTNMTIENNNNFNNVYTKINYNNSIIKYTSTVKKYNESNVNINTPTWFNEMKEEKAVLSASITENNYIRITHKGGKPLNGVYTITVSKQKNNQLSIYSSPTMINLSNGTKFYLNIYDGKVQTGELQGSLNSEKNEIEENYNYTVFIKSNNNNNNNNTEYTLNIS